MKKVDVTLFRIRINYKSGNSYEGWFKSFKFNYSKEFNWCESMDPEKLLTLNYNFEDKHIGEDDYVENRKRATPNILELGISNIESIIQLGARDAYYYQKD